MAEDATMVLDSGHPFNSSPTLLANLSTSSEALGRRLPRTEAPEGWIRKIERRREGKVWVGFFHLWTTDAQGRRVRHEEGKDARTRFDAKARGTAEAG